MNLEPRVPPRRRQQELPERAGTRSLETLMVVMSYADFATAQKGDGAMRFAQSAAEACEKLFAGKRAEIVGRTDRPTHLDEAEARKLTALPASR